MSEIKNSIAEY
jgi:hypothetical protein